MQISPKQKQQYQFPIFDQDAYHISEYKFDKLIIDICRIQYIINQNFQRILFNQFHIRSKFPAVFFTEFYVIQNISSQTNSNKCIIQKNCTSNDMTFNSNFHYFFTIVYQVIKQMLSSIILLISLYNQLSNAETSTLTCTSDPKVYKFDIREYVDSLGQGSKISNINVLQVCDMAYMYDYIWITQLWTPSKFNYDLVANKPQQVNNYRELQNIKEYIIDPVLGDAVDYFNFQQQLRQKCYHLKILGEFSFYIGTDSSLVQNKTRFLLQPYTQISPNYNSRYDLDGFVQATSDKGRIIPFSAVWNYFKDVNINDMRDIIQRQIIQQYKFDGIVFLQPSLGLYQFQNKYYNNEISFFAQSAYLKDFYVNFGLWKQITPYIYMGADDNLQAKFFLIYSGLFLVYNQEDSRNWVTAQYKYSMTLRTMNTIVSDFSNYCTKYVPAPWVTIVQRPSLTQPMCVRFNFSVHSGGSGIGVLDLPLIQTFNYDPGHMNNINHGEYGVFGPGTTVHSDDWALNWKVGYTFSLAQLDQIELQYDPLTRYATFYKYKTNLKFRMYVGVDPSKIAFASAVTNANEQIDISFPYQFSPEFSSPNTQIKGDKNIIMSTTQTLLTFAQVEPSMDQDLFPFYELDFRIQNIPAGSSIGVGICNRDQIKFNNFKGTSDNLGIGAYLFFSDGTVVHNSNVALNNQNISFTFNSVSVMMVRYTIANKTVSITDFYDRTQTRKMTTGRIKNANFCVGMKKQGSDILLVW
ncbi:hypothetical protein pb186bvf_004172 [Paramecium bursaria]